MKTGTGIAIAGACMSVAAIFIAAPEHIAEGLLLAFVVVMGLILL